MIPRKSVRVGLKVRRAGTSRTEVGRARRAQVFVVSEIDGDFRRDGFSRALLTSPLGGPSFWVSDFTKWDKASA
jgi:hypothetical protein